MSTPPAKLLRFDDLLAAYEWVSAGAQYQNTAYVCRATGTTHWAGDPGVIEEPLPDDVEDGTLYVEVPHWNDLDLGRNLAFDFVEAHLPDAYESVRGLFRQKGAHGRFKDLLSARGRLDDWHRYQSEAVEKALREWCADEDLPLDT